MSSTPCAPPPSVPFHFCLFPAPFLFPFPFPSVTQGQPVPLLQSSLHSHTKFCPSSDSLFSPHPHLSYTSASLCKPMEILPNQRQGGSIHPPKYKEQNQRGELESCQTSPRGEKKATDDNKNVACCHDNHSHSATVPRVWRQQNQLHVYFPSTTRLSKQEEAKKEMPSLLCPSPAREPGYLVAAGLPFRKQPSVVTSLSAEPDSSLVSTGFQTVPCAQVRRLNPGLASVAPILGHMASMDGWLQGPEGSVQTRLCLWSGRWEVEPHLTKQEAASLLRVKPKPNNEKQSNQ